MKATVREPLREYTYIEVTVAMSRAEWQKVVERLMGSPDAAVQAFCSVLKQASDDVGGPTEREVESCLDQKVLTDPRRVAWDPEPQEAKNNHLTLDPDYHTDLGERGPHV